MEDMAALPCAAPESAVLNTKVTGRLRERVFSRKSKTRST